MSSTMRRRTEQDLARGVAGCVGGRQAGAGGTGNPHVAATSHVRVRGGGAVAGDIGREGSWGAVGVGELVAALQSQVNFQADTYTNVFTFICNYF